MKVPQWFSVNLITSLHHSGSIKLVKENSSRNIQISPIVFSAGTVHFNKYLIQLNLVLEVTEELSLCLGLTYYDAHWVDGIMYWRVSLNWGPFPHELCVSGDFYKIIEYLELEGNHKGHWVQIPAPCRCHPVCFSSHPPKVSGRWGSLAMSLHILNSTTSNLT